MSSITYDGNKTLAAVVPGIFGSWQAEIAAQLVTVTDLYNQLSALNPQTLSALTTDVTQALTALKTLVTDMTNAVGSAQVPAESAANISCFTLSCPANAMGGYISTELATGDPAGGSPTDPCQAFLLLTRTPATFAVMQSLFGGA